MKEDRIDIVACTDRWFVMPTGVMMYSVCVNNPDVDIVFHVIHDDSVTSKDRRDLEETVTAFQGKQIFFYHVIETMFVSFPNLEIRSDITQATYYRLMISEILPDSIQKVLFLDGDIIVRNTLLPLWNTDLSNHAVAAVCDPTEGNFVFYSRLGYSPQLGYFNAGVLLINLGYWREHDVVMDFQECIRTKASALKAHDQDVLNCVFHDNKVHLPIKYNLHRAFLDSDTQFDDRKYGNELLEALSDPVIVHFSDEKPWYKYSRQSIHPFASTFFKYQRQTKWKGKKIDKRPFKLRVVNYVADILRKYGLKPQLPPIYEYIDIAPID